MGCRQYENIIVYEKLVEISQEKKKKGKKESDENPEED